MRPVSLTFSGLRSYRGQATIDFSSLDLFAVIGDTGAGKSTIIEALSLVLYGDKTWSGGRLDQVIADGANASAYGATSQAGGPGGAIPVTAASMQSERLPSLACRPESPWE